MKRRECVGASRTEGIDAASGSLLPSAKSIFTRPPSDGPTLSCRLATPDDVAQLRTIMDASIAELQRGFLDPEQIAASRLLMGLDTDLIEDRTYYVAVCEGVLAGCGGWGRRATLYGGDHSPGRQSRLLDPARDAARIRAMYTAPGFARRGVGRLILGVSEAAAAAGGFGRAELVSTLSGEPLYAACGYSVVERFSDRRSGIPVPLVRMAKALG